MYTRTTFNTEELENRIKKFRANWGELTTRMFEKKLHQVKNCKVNGKRYNRKT